MPPLKPPRVCPGGPGPHLLLPCPAEKVTSLGKDWHRPCLRCERCGKTLTPGGHAEVRVPRAGGGCPSPSSGSGLGFGRLRPRGVGGALTSSRLRGVGQTRVCPASPPRCPSMPASRTATSPATESSSDPRVSVAGRLPGMGACPAPPHYSSSSFCRSEHGSRGQLHL